MKKALLFATGAGIGVVVGYLGCVASLLLNVGTYDETIYEDNKMKIRKASEFDDDGGFAKVTYKKQETTNE